MYVNPEPHSREFGNASAPLPFMGAPSRKILKIQRRILPSGRVVQFVWRVSTRNDDRECYVTLELVSIPRTDCGCAPQSISDIYECMNRDCLGTVCGSRGHAQSCRACGQTFCSRCVISVNVEHAVCIVCKNCADELRAGMLKKLVRKIMEWCRS